MKQSKTIVEKAKNGYIVTSGKQVVVLQGGKTALANDYAEKVVEEVEECLKNFTKCQIEITISGISDNGWYTREAIPCDFLPLICMNKGDKNPEILYHKDGRFYYSRECVGQYRSEKPEFWRYAPTL